MNLLKNLITAVSNIVRSPEEMIKWKLTLVCSDGCFEYQFYDTEEEATEFGAKQLNVTYGRYKVTDIIVEPFSVDGLLLKMLSNAKRSNVIQ